MPLGVVVPGHPRWEEFCDRLEGPEGCNFRYEPPTSTDAKDVRWECDSLDRSLPKATAILRSMGATDTEIEAARYYYHGHGGYCDCEILFNVMGNEPWFEVDATRKQ